MAESRTGVNVKNVSVKITETFFFAKKNHDCHQRAGLLAVVGVIAPNVLVL